MMPRRISIHIVSEFVKMFLLVLFTVFIIVFIVDFLEFSPKIQDYSISPKNSVEIILFRIPTMMEPTIQFIVLLSIIFTMAKFLSKNELIVFYSSGISDWKIVRLLGATAFIVGVFFATVYSKVSTSLLKKSDMLERKCKGKVEARYFIQPKNGIWLRQIGSMATNDSRAASKSYDIVIRATEVFLGDLIFNDVILVMFSDEGFFRRINADCMQIIDNNLILSDARIVEQGKSILRRRKVVISTSVQQDFIRRQIQDRYGDLKFIDSLSLGKLIGEIKSYGLSARKFEIKRNNFILLPFLHMLMAFIGILMSENNPRDAKYTVKTLQSVIVGMVLFALQNTIAELSNSGRINYISSSWGFFVSVLLLTYMKLINKIELKNS
ncbi:MAG: LptF/LptG family permease [Rickettsiales bacterium]|jgi:lipopolysaccharide export system permease protein|nr:LptF/LptG family permease [Rickettsiales bacterium]